MAKVTLFYGFTRPTVLVCNAMQAESITVVLLRPEAAAFPFRNKALKGILKYSVCHLFNFIGQIILIFNTVQSCNFGMDEFNPTYLQLQRSPWFTLQIHNIKYRTIIANKSFQIASFKNIPFKTGRFDCSCQWAENIRLQNLEISRDHLITN